MAWPLFGGDARLIDRRRGRQRLVVRNRRIHPIPLLALLFLAVASQAATANARSACPADCDAAGTVTIDELTRAVRIALAEEPLGDCQAADVDHDGFVTIGDLIAAVVAALDGCAPTPTPTPNAANCPVLDIYVPPEGLSFVSPAHVAVRPDGQFVVTWSAETSDPKTVIATNVTAQRFDAAGERIGAPIGVATYAEELAPGPFVALDAEGSFLIVWPHDPTPGTSSVSNGKVSARRFSESGVPGAPEQLLPSQPPATLLAMAGDAAGNVELALTRPSLSYPGVYEVDVQRIAPDGRPAGDAIPIYEDHCYGSIDVAMSADGDLLAACASFNAVSARHFDKSGQPVGASFPVAKASELSSYRQTRVIHLSNGEFIVLWSREDHLTFDVTLMGRAYDESGSAVSDPFEVPFYLRGEVFSAAALPNGQFLVVGWTLNDDEEVLAARRFDEHGNPLGSEFIVAPVYLVCALSFDSGADSRGNAVVVWSDLCEGVGGRIVTADASDPCAPTLKPTPTKTPTPLPPSSTPTGTVTLTPTITETPTPSLCGDGILQAGETCDSCPADCQVLACSPGPPTQTFSVELQEPLGSYPTSVLVVVGYRSDRVALPASGAATRIKNRPPGSSVLVNVVGYGVDVVLLDNPLPSGQLFTIDFDSCDGAPLVSSADFGCQVASCGSSEGPIEGCTCVVRAFATAGTLDDRARERRDEKLPHLTLPHLRKSFARSIVYP